MPENEQTPAPTPAAPPATHIDASMFSDRTMRTLAENYILTSAELDQIEKARIAGREAQRTAEEKIRVERLASSKRAEEAVAEVFKRDAETPEDQKPTEPGQPAFELEVSELLPADLKEEAGRYAEDLANIGTDVGIGQEEMQIIFDTAVDLAVTLLPTGEVVNLADQDECRALMVSRWGEDAAKQVIADANKAVERLGPDVRAWLNHVHQDGGQVGNSPATVYALAAWYRGTTRLSPKEAESQIATIRERPEYQKGDKRYTDLVALLSKVAARGQSQEMTFEKPAAAPVKSSVQKEIDAIRKDPKYSSRDAKVRAPLVKRMNELMRNAYPD